MVDLIEFEKAIHDGDEDKINSHLKDGADVSYGLSIAAKNNDLKISEFFLKKNAKAHYGLAAAIEHNNLDLLKMLLATKITPSLLSNYLALAAQAGKLEIVKILISNKADSSMGLDGAINNGDDAMVDYLFAKGANPIYGFEAAIKKNDLSSIKKLLDKGADPTQGLNHAVNYKNYDILEYLLDKGANGSAALNHSIWLGDEQSIEMVLRFGADASSGLESAIAKKDIKLITKLIDLGGDLTTAIEIAAKHKFDDLVSELTNQGGNLNQALENAIYDKKLDLVKTLISNGADIISGFFKAFKSNHQPIIDYIFSEIKDLNKAARLAAKESELDALKFLFDKEVKLDSAVIGIFGFKNNLIKLIKDNLPKNSYVFNIGDKHLRDLTFIKYFNGLIIGGERYKHFSGKEFSLTDLPKDKITGNEKIFQDVIQLVNDKNIPLLAISGGFQHLALNKGATIEPVKNYLNSNKHEASFISNSFAYFLTLTDKEQIAALKDCSSPEVVIKNIHTNHKSAVKSDSLDEAASIAATSEDGVIEAISYGSKLIGYQFHPEEHYGAVIKGEINREKNIIDNFIKLIIQRYKATQFAVKKNMAPSSFFDLAENEVLARLEQCAGNSASEEESKIKDLLNQDYWVELSKSKDLFADEL